MTPGQIQWLRAKAREWFPAQHPEVAEQRAFNRLINLGLRRCQEDPNAMAALLRSLDSPDDD